MHQLVKLCINHPFELRQRNYIVGSSVTKFAVSGRVGIETGGHEYRTDRNIDDFLFFSEINGFTYLFAFAAPGTVFNVDNRNLRIFARVVFVNSLAGICSEIKFIGHFNRAYFDSSFQIIRMACRCIDITRCFLYFE